MPVDFILQHFIHIGALLYLVCFLFRDQMLLRTFAILGDLAYIAYYFVASDVPLWSAILYSSVYVLVNAAMILLILKDRRHTNLSDNDLKLYQAFGGMSPGDFRRLTSIGEWHSPQQLQTLTEEGKPMDQLCYVLEGDIEISKAGRDIPVDGGLFIGEIAFLKQVPASATVTAKPGSLYIAWKQSDLRKAFTRHDSLKNSLLHLLSSDMAGKVARS